MLGPERTRSELIPYVTELIDDEDEVLVALAENLGNLLSHVGGASKIEFLLNPLEQMGNIEEHVVRDQAAVATAPALGVGGSDVTRILRDSFSDHETHAASRAHSGRRPKAVSVRTRTPSLGGGTARSPMECPSGV